MQLISLSNCIHLTQRFAVFTIIIYLYLVFLYSQYCSRYVPNHGTSYCLLVPLYSTLCFPTCTGTQPGVAAPQEEEYSGIPLGCDEEEGLISKFIPELDNVGEQEDRHVLLGAPQGQRDPRCSRHW